MDKQGGEKIRFARIWKSLAAYALIAAAVCLAFQTIFLLAIVPSESMEDTIAPGDIVFCTRYDRGQVERYDIVVIRAGSGYYIKRVAGMPGETVEIKDGKVYADGEALDEPFIKEEMDPSGDGVYQVPEGHYFLLGDNRNHSLDSRFWDDPYVSEERIAGHARAVVFPLSHFCMLP